MDGILKGIKVVELGNFVAAPSATVIMGYLGADVIKVEPPISDLWRTFGLNSVTEWKLPKETPAWENYNSNKRDITIDLSQEDGREVFFKLLEDADVFVTNNRQKALVKMGIDYDSIKDRFPKLVYALVTGFGMNGPDKDEPGYDTVSFWARSGLMADLVPINGMPLTTPGSVGDVVTGMGLFGIICAALWSREKTGKGDFVESSLYGSAIWVTSMMNLIAAPCYGNKYPKDRYDGNPLITSYRTKDNEWFTFTVVTANYDKLFKPICDEFGHPEIYQNPRFADYTVMNLEENRGEALHIIEDMFAEHTWAEIEAVAKKVGCTCQRMSHYAEVSADPQAWANNYFHETVFPSGDKFPQSMPPMKSRNNGEFEHRLGPNQGADNIQILKELGYSDEYAKAYDEKYKVK